MTSDKNKNISAITYNHLNLPTKITFVAKGTIEYIYNAVGQKIQKIVHSLLPTPSVTTTDYLGGFQYKDNVLQYFPHAEGYVEPNGSSYKYVYQYKDHLGNVRVSYEKNTDGSLKIVDESNYYPFGLKHSYNTITPESEYKYKYNGKELQDELGLNAYDYGARNYDPALGRWMNVDPLAEMSRRFSPYTYANNNPIYFIDPDGMIVKNGDQDGRDEAKKNQETAQANFDSKSSGYDKKTASKDEKRAYKDAKSDLKQANREFKRADEKYQHTQNSIENFATVDPEGFAKIDNLKNGKTGANIDVIVTTSDSSINNGGKTDIIPPNANNDIEGGAISLHIDSSISVSADVLAHEFGHAEAYANDPASYYKSAVDAAQITNYDCQDSSNYSNPVTINAHTWQTNYNINYNKKYRK